jgi:hypothetical protein
LSPFQAQIDDPERDFALDGEHVRQLTVEPSGPQWKIITDPDELDVDPQLLASPILDLYERVWEVLRWALMTTSFPQTKRLTTY